MDKRKIINKITDKLFFLVGKKDKEKNYLLKSMCLSGQKYGNYFITYREREKTIENRKIIDELIKNDIPKIAIIMQGPLRREDAFTLETLKWYKKMYPDFEIILSTWDDIDSENENIIIENGIKIIKNKKPGINGLGNMNYQLVSTKAGIEYAKERKCKYILKTRTDQRIYKKYFLEYFLSLINEYKIDVNKTKQNSRIIVGPGIVEGNMFKPYMISDFIYFGTTEDIELLFSCDLDKISMSTQERTEWINSLKGNTNILEFFEKTAPEMHIIKEFCDKTMKEKHEFTIKDYWDFIKESLICEGWNDISLYWPKYEIFNESKIESSLNKSEDETYEYCWDFSTWLLLYNNFILYDEKYEEKLKTIMK